MQNKIREHREQMGFKSTRLSVETKLLEELNELRQEVKVPTTRKNLMKEQGDVIITIAALCELNGYTIDEVVDYAIKINEGRVR